MTEGGDINPPKTGSGGMGGFLGKSTMGLPNWAWLLVIAAGIAAAIIIPKTVGKGKSTGGTSTSGQGLGLAIDPTNGLPYAVEGLVPSGAMAGGGGGGGITATGVSPSPVDTSVAADNSWWNRRYNENDYASTAIPIEKPTTLTQTASRTVTTPAPPQLMKAQIREKNSQAAYTAYDATSNGVPVRSTPNGKETGKAPFGTIITITGSPVVAGGNQGNQNWYPVEGGGYVSQYDVTNLGRVGSVGKWP